jgi:hypothetical protein
VKTRNSGKSIEPGQAAAANAPAPRKRFHIQKLEERIAPKKGGGGVQLGKTSSGMSFPYSYGGPY